MRPNRWTTPPRALRRYGVKFDNVALVPGNLLPFKEQWQALANTLPQGNVLIVLPGENNGVNRTLRALSRRMTDQGKCVKTIVWTVAK